jgi:hypothetical protein
MCICMRVCMYVFEVLHTRLLMYAHGRMCMYVCVYARMNTYIHACMYVFEVLHTRLLLMYAHRRMCMYVCASVYAPRTKKNSLFISLTHSLTHCLSLSLSK